MTSPAASPETSTDVLAVANMPLLWVSALGVFLVIIVQTAIYMKAARRAGPGVGMDRHDLRVSFRSGAVAALGPSVAVVIVALSLLALFGTPGVLVRIGLIGSVAYETGAASIAAGAAGAELGGPGYTQTAFAVAFFAMSAGGAMWMLATLLLTPVLQRSEKRIARLNPLVLTVVPGAALVAAFLSLGIAEVRISAAHTTALVVGGASMGLAAYAASRLSLPWIREWGLGLSILSGLAAAYVADQAGLGLGIS
ncbi:DUF5058 family protein [Nesterenkonia sp. PF2B19]|uniref:DUF5058 family protein n=1 Tax=unclassified Nesterenkonia TaxID=2629769 RepID=UPI00087202AB|nr:DUF5058 family protein [Nesterenkonia sp. PF2B19]OSM44024.1 DUF5058 domain-containing protein [Nesterenkonia sp. PF2B19]